MAQGDAQWGRQNDGHRAVENGRRDLQRQSCGSCGCGEAAHQQTVVSEGLEEVENVIGHAAQRGGNGAAAVLGFFPVSHGKTCRQTHDAFGDEGDPALRRIGRVGQIVQRRADAGGYAAHRPQQQAGQTAHDVGQREGRPPADGNGHGDPQIIADKHQSSHHAQHGQLVYISFFLIHGNTSYV